MYDNSIPKISLEAARINAHMTQQEVAEALGINRDTVRRYEQGKSCPTFKTFIKLAELYNFPKDYIFLPDSPL